MDSGGDEAPDAIRIKGSDAANGTYDQLYADDRGVRRVYEMSVGSGDRGFEDDRQHDRGPLGEGGGRINFEVDFDLIYRRIR